MAGKRTIAWRNKDRFWETQKAVRPIVVIQDLVYRKLDRFVALKRQKA